MKFKPNQDRILVLPEPVEQKTASGIIIPETAKERPQRGKIVAVGEGKLDEPMIVKEGDLVLYGKHSGAEITLDGVDYLVMKESDLFAIIEE